MGIRERATLLWSEIMGGYNTPYTIVEIVLSVKVGHEIIVLYQPMYYKFYPC